MAIMPHIATASVPLSMSRDIPIAHIDPDPEQPRKHFDPDALVALGQSMVETGLAVPILVRPVGDRFMIVHGERRWRAATALGWTTIPALVQELSAHDARWLALVENVQRNDLTPLEEALAYQSQLDLGLTQAELGKRIGKSQSSIAQKLRLLTLPEPLACYLYQGALSEGHTRQLLTLRNLYGEDAAQQLVIPENTDKLDYSDPMTLFLLFNGIRPEDASPVPVGPFGKDGEDLHPALSAGFATFDRWATKAGGVVPSWAVAAFWWGSLVVDRRLSVADLSQRLDRWRERLMSALAWAAMPEHELRAGRSMSKQSTALAMEHYGYWSDLRHAGMMRSIVALTERHADEIIHVIDNGIRLPSDLQPWGNGHKRYGEALAAEGLA